MAGSSCSGVSVEVLAVVLKSQVRAMTMVLVAIGMPFGMAMAAVSRDLGEHVSW